MVRFRVAAIALGFALAGCRSVEPAGDMFAPVPRTAAPAETVAPDESPAGGFDFEAEDREETEPTAPGETPLSPDEAMAGLGITPADLEEQPAVADAEPTPAPAPETAPPPQAAAPTGPPAWPTAAPGTWGVRLVSVVPDAQPPMAVLGMPDGKEEVVRPGALLPGPGIVVLAIGRDAVQIAEIKPQGDHAVVETRVLQAMYPGREVQR